MLEDHILAKQGTKKRQRPFSREVAEMVRYAVGYRSRAIVTFGNPIAVDGIDPESRREVLTLAHSIMAEIGRVYKVLPTALVANAMRPSITRRACRSRAPDALPTVCARRRTRGRECRRRSRSACRPVRR